MKDIYDLLNEVKADTEDLEEQPVPAAQLHRMKSRIRKTIKAEKGDRTMKMKKKAICAAACAAAMCVAFVPFSQTAYAKGLYYDIAHFLGIEKDLGPYKTVVDETKTDAGISVTLKEVILDEDTMTVASLIALDESLGRLDEYMSPVEELNIFVNGREVREGASGGSRQVDTNAFESVISYDLGSLDGDQLDIRLEYTGFLLLGQEIKGNWGFEFSASREELALKTDKYPVDYSFTMENGCRIELTECIVNAMGVKIDFTFSGGRAADYDMMLEGEDDLGNPVAFYLSRIRDGEGRFLLETIDNGNLSGDAASLTLTPYARQMPEQSGRITGEYEAAGEPFTVKIH